jgi:hypothetical protein
LQEINLNVSTEELLSANIPDSAAYAVYFNRDRNAKNAFDFEKLVHQHWKRFEYFSEDDVHMDLNTIII